MRLLTVANNRSCVFARQMGADGNASANQTRQGQHMKNVFRVISVAFIPVVGGMASVSR